MLPCVTISQTTGQDSTTQIQFQDSTGKFAQWILTQPIQKYKPLTLQPEQVFNVYLGLQYGEMCADDLASCKEIAHSLNGIIQRQNDSIQKAAAELKAANAFLYKAQDDFVKESLKVQKLESKGFGWLEWLAIAAAALVGYEIGK